MASQVKLTREQTLFAEIKNYDCVDENNIAFTNYNNNRNDNNYLAQLVIYLRGVQQCTPGQKGKIVDLRSLLQERILFDYEYPQAVIEQGQFQEQKQVQQLQQIQPQHELQDQEAQQRFRGDVDQRFSNIENILQELVNMQEQGLQNQEEISSGVMEAIASIEGVQQGVDAMHGDLKKGFKSIQDKMADCIPPPAAPLAILYCFLSLISLIIVVLVLVHKIYYQITMTTSRIMSAVGGSIPGIGGFLGATMQGMTLIIFALAYINFITFITGGLIQGTVIAGNILYYIKVFIETIFGFALDNLRGLKTTLSEILETAFPEFEGIQASLVNLKDAIIELIRPYIEETKEEVAQAAREAAREAVEKTVRAPVDAVGNAMGAAANATSNALSTASDAVADALGDAVDFTRRNIRMGGGDGSGDRAKGMDTNTGMNKFEIIPSSTEKHSLSECLIDACVAFDEFGVLLTNLANKLESDEIQQKLPNCLCKENVLLTKRWATAFTEQEQTKKDKSFNVKKQPLLIEMVKPFMKQGIEFTQTVLKSKPLSENLNIKTIVEYVKKVAAGSPYEIKKQESRLKKILKPKIEGSMSPKIEGSMSSTTDTGGGKRRKKTRKKKRRKKRKSNKKRKNKKKRTKRKNKKRRTKKRRRR
jgi:hypothetical protein